MRSIDDWYLNYENADGGESTDDDRPDRNPDAWLDRVAHSPDMREQRSPRQVPSPTRRPSSTDRRRSTRKRRRNPAPPRPLRRYRTKDLIIEVARLTRSLRIRPSTQALAVYLRSHGWEELTWSDAEWALNQVKLAELSGNRTVVGEPSRRLEQPYRDRTMRSSHRQAIEEDRVRSLPPPQIRAADVCPACGVRVSHLGTCRCS